MGSRGRPRKTGGTRREQRKRAKAREASALYYKRNRKKVLAKARAKS